MNYVQIAVLGFKGIARMTHNSSSHLQNAYHPVRQIEPLHKWYVDSGVRQS